MCRRNVAVSDVGVDFHSRKGSDITTLLFRKQILSNLAKAPEDVSDRLGQDSNVIDGAVKKKGLVPRYGKPISNDK